MKASIHPRAGVHRPGIGWAAVLAMIVIANAVDLHGQTLTDPGFENYSVASGGFVQPASGPWLFGNDAGVVEPPAPNSSTAPLNTWSATFAPVDGLQYASTYAGVDILRQLVSFSAAGDYQLSVFAAAPNGSLTIPSVGTVTLGSGEFTFTLGNAAIGSLHPVPAGTSWGLFTTDVTIPAPGDYLLGIRNTLSAPYFINYDAFAIQPVPEPSAIALLLVGALGAAVCWSRREK